MHLFSSCILNDKMLTEKQLNAICPALKGAYLRVIVTAINKVTPFYKMDALDILEEFIPNLLVECAEFTKFEENLNYSPQRLMVVWPKRFLDLTTAKQFAYQKEKLANYVYGGRLGNNKPGDGWHFRGSGPIQATGKEIVTTFSVFHNKKFGTSFTPYQMAEKMRDHINLEMGLHFACWFFSIAKGLIQMAINDQFNPIVLRINGGYTGLDQRTIYYKRARMALAA